MRMSFFRPDEAISGREGDGGFSDALHGAYDETDESITDETVDLAHDWQQSTNSGL